jgi:hypothetical protein
VKPLAVPLAALALAAALAGRGYAQTVPPRATPVPWQPRPVIIIDPRPYLATPRPAPHASAKRHATPHPRATPPLRRTPRAAQTPETFERIDTSPPPARPPR